MGKQIIFIFMLVLMISLVCAAPPFAEEGAETFSKGFFVEYTPIGTYKNSQNLQVNSHVFNISTGKELDNSTVVCKLSLFNQSGNHVINNVNMTFATNGNDWEYTILGSNFTANGEYAYLVDCQDDTGNFGGFVAVEFKITNTGFDLDTSKAIIYASMFFLLIFFFGIILFAISLLPSSNEKDEDGKIMSISYLKYLRGTLWFFEWFLVLGIMFLASNLGFAYLGETLFANIFFNIYRVMFSISPLIITVWILWILVKAYHDKQFQNMLKRGIFPQGKL